MKGVQRIRPVIGTVGVFTDVNLNKLLNKQSNHWSSETPRRSGGVAVMKFGSIDATSSHVNITGNFLKTFQSN